MSEYTKGNEIATIDVALVTIEDESGNILGLNTASKIDVNPVTETKDAVKLIIKGALLAQKGSSTVVTGHTIVLTDNVFNPQEVQLLQGGVIVFSKNYTNTVGVGGQPAEACYFQIDSEEYVSFTLANALAENDTIVYNDVTGILTVTKGGVSARQTRTIVATEPVAGTELTMVEVSDETHIRKYTPPLAGAASDQEVLELHAYSAIYNAAGICTGYECISYPNCKGVPVSMSSEDDVFRVPEYTLNSAPNTGEAPYEIEYVPELPTLATT